MTDNRTVRWFTDLDMKDTMVAGGKGANLGELTQAGFPVPPGFVITAQAYLRTMEQAGLRTDLVTSASCAPDQPGPLTDLSTSLTRRIRDIEIPPEVYGPVLAAYRLLGEPPVAVRSSATSEDTARTSFAGMYETFTNVEDGAELLICIKDCWAAAYGARAIAYRADRQITDEPAMAVVIQTMVRSDRAGVMFSADPSTGDRERIVIEAAFGLGEVVARGELVPDTYILDRTGTRLLEIRIGHKDHKIVCGAEGQDVRVDLSGDEAGRRVLRDEEAIGLAELALQVQEHYGEPQDLEWAIQDEVTYLVQSRPITSQRLPTVREPVEPVTVRGRLVAGLGAAAGVATGPVRMLTSPEDADQFHDGDILVAPTTSPDWMPVLRRAAALVTDGGGITCHGAIISRELGIPAIVGTRIATQILHEGQRITVDGGRGLVEEEATVSSAVSP